MRKSEAVAHLLRALNILERDEARLHAQHGPHSPRSIRAFNVKTIKALQLLLAAQKGTNG